MGADPDVIECLIVDGPHAGEVVDVYPGQRVVDLWLPSPSPVGIRPAALGTVEFQRYKVYPISISKAVKFADPVLIGLPHGSRANPSVAAFEYAMRICFDLGRRRG